MEELGPDNAFVKAVLGGRSPKEAAAAIIGGTKLADPAVRKQLIDGGEAAVKQSTDPLIVMSRAIDPILRDLTKKIETEVTSVESGARQKIGQARFAVYGTSVYPDATFTLRLSYGKASGYPMNGTRAPYKTTFAGLYDRSAGFDDKPPFDLDRASSRAARSSICRRRWTSSPRTTSSAAIPDRRWSIEPASSSDSFSTATSRASSAASSTRRPQPRGRRPQRRHRARAADDSRSWRAGGRADLPAGRRTAGLWALGFGLWALGQSLKPKVVSLVS